MKPGALNSSRRAGLGRSERGFTMVEVAICLAIIGFALVGILGVLPSAMQTQKDNREDTIINQDGSYLIEAIRSGAQGLDQLTNYVEAITNTQTVAGTPTKLGYTAFTSGAQIIGLLSTPRYEGAASNYVVAYVRAISGPAVDKGVNADSREFAFHYRLVTEIAPAGLPELQAFDWSQTNGMSAGQQAQVRAGWDAMNNTATNLHEVRLLFRWPLFRGVDPDTGDVRTGNGRQIFRTLASGPLVRTNGIYFFFQPNNYSKMN